MLAAAPQPEFSPLVLLILVLIAGASAAVFFLTVRRWTTRRQWVSLAEWAGARGMKLASGERAWGARGLSALPAPLDRIARYEPRVRMAVRTPDDRTLIVQVETVALSQSVSAEHVEAGNIGMHVSTAAVDTPVEAVRRFARWNLLMRRVSQPTTSAAGLRPTNTPSSAIDLFGLSAFHSMSNDRFAVVASDARSASALSRGSARALLPADVGLLLIGDHVVLDFSSRPFDPVELDRMLSVVDQVCRMC